jgi:hypothetical protein
MRKTKRFELDPKETARENLWRAATIAAGVVLSRKSLKLTGDEWRELHLLIVEKGVEHFMKHKIGLHKYNRAQPFYNNVYSSCWSVSHNVTTKFLRELKRKISGVSLDSPSYHNGFEMLTRIEDTGKHPLDNSEVIDERGILEAKLEHTRKKLRETHNKRFYGVSVERLEAALKLDEEMTREELKESLGI